jgi:hypothetical protein
MAKEKKQQITVDGKVVFFDDKDRNIVLRYEWRFSPEGIYIRGRTPLTYMHKIVGGEEAFHKNGDVCDNTGANIGAPSIEEIEVKRTERLAAEEAVALEGEELEVITTDEDMENLVEQVKVDIPEPAGSSELPEIIED